MGLMLWARMRPATQVPPHNAMLNTSRMYVCDFGGVIEMAFSGIGIGRVRFMMIVRVFRRGTLLRIAMQLHFMSAGYYDVWKRDEFLVGIMMHLA